MVPVIDLFAGPGGLSEGFEQCQVSRKQIFRCVLSIEKDTSAHRTLLLRAFVRQFKTPPAEYYEHVRQRLTLANLYKAYPIQYRRAKREAIRLALASRNRRRIDKLIFNALRGRRKSWVLIGGPPCQAYSIAGRAKIRAEIGAKFEKDGRHFLYKEYLHIVKKFKPPVFVMENVKGLLSSSTNQIKTKRQKRNRGETFRRILADFASAGYSVHSFVKIGSSKQLTPTDYVIHAERFGIPQTRHRVILLGIRHGIDRGSSLLRPRKRVCIQSAIGDLPRIRSRISPLSRDSFNSWLSELHRLRSLFTKDGDLRGMNGSRRVLLPLPIGNAFIHTPYPRKSLSKWLRSNDAWFVDRRLEGVTLHESRCHMPRDLRRYLFASHFARIYGASPKISDFMRQLRPEHKNIENAVSDPPFADRFRVQVRGKPATTVVSHISKDGHYYIHFDPTQCRSLTVREAARLQTFPDNYYFVGTKTAQYHQVGNAVPPLLARSIARIVYRIVDRLP